MGVPFRAADDGGGDPISRLRGKIDRGFDAPCSTPSAALDTASVILARLVGTATFRLAAGFAALFSVSIIAVSSIVYVAMTRYSDQQIDLSISAEVKTIRDALAGASAPEIVKAINDRLTDIDPDYFYYALQDPDGGVLAGNLRPLPATTGWADIPLKTIDGDGNRERHIIRGLGVDLTPELRLFIGRDTHDLDELQEGITSFFLAGAAATVLLALAGGLVLSARFLRRVEAVNTAARHIMDGHLDERVPSRGKADEFDRPGRQPERDAGPHPAS